LRNFDMLFRRAAHTPPPRLELVAPYIEPEIPIPPALEPIDLLKDIRTDMPDLDELAIRRIARSLLAHQVGEVNALVAFDHDSEAVEPAKVLQLFPAYVEPAAEIKQQS
jgi:hypothetical protein